MTAEMIGLAERSLAADPIVRLEDKVTFEVNLPGFRVIAREHSDEHSLRESRLGLADRFAGKLGTLRDREGCPFPGVEQVGNQKGQARSRHGQSHGSPDQLAAFHDLGLA